MKLRALIILVVLALVALFATMNWTAITSPTALTLGFMDVNAPLGLILLIATAAVSGLFFLYIVFQQAGIILETRRYARELKGQRELADKAEASRFTELRAFLDGEIRRIEAQSSATSRELGGLIGQLEQGIHGKFAESTRTISAYLGEIEDKLDRVLPPMNA